MELCRQHVDGKAQKNPHIFTFFISWILPVMLLFFIDTYSQNLCIISGLSSLFCVATYLGTLVLAAKAVVLNFARTLETLGNFINPDV